MNNKDNSQPLTVADEVEAIMATMAEGRRRLHQLESRDIGRRGLCGVFAELVSRKGQRSSPFNGRDA
jgi:hypothetical protein